MPAIAGLRGTGDWGTDERPKSFREMILWMKPNGQAPLTALMAKMKKQSVNDPEFAWWTETLNIVRLQVNGALLSTDTALVVDLGALDLKVGDLLLVERFGVAEGTVFANEVVRVTAVASDTAATMTRGAAGSTAAAIEDNSLLTLIGSAHEEGSVKPAATTRNPAKFFNYTQIFKDGYSITNTAKETFARTGDPLKNDKKRKMFDHSTRLELAWLFGKRSETTGAGGKPLRTTAGLLFYLAAASRIIDKAATNYTAGNIDVLVDDVKDVFDLTGDGSDSGGDERIMLCGNGFLNAVNKLATKAGVVNYGEIVKVYGMNLMRFVIPQGTFYLKSHPLMNQHSLYTNSAFIIDPPNFRYRPLGSRDTKPETNIQTPGTDAEEGQWLTEAGLEVHHPGTMKFLTSVGWAAS